VDDLSSQLSRVRFDYTDPEKGFDRAKVKGVVAKLLRVKEPAAATALEVLAGGKLYQVVVDTDATSKALLQKGQLRQRVTIIPLNRVNARTATERQLQAAHKAAGTDPPLTFGSGVFTIPKRRRGRSRPAGGGRTRALSACAPHPPAIVQR
jgi:structural maintenance of chromosome 2